MMPTIRIEDDVMNALKSLAQPFTDTPNSVIKRLLQEHGVLPKEGPSGDGADQRDDGASGNGSPAQPVYELFLLHVLRTEFNGKAGKHEATKTVLDRMQARGLLKPRDFEPVSTGESRAANTIAWARNALKDQGLVSRYSPRGVWELTVQGIEAADKVQLPGPAMVRVYSWKVWDQNAGQTKIAPSKGTVQAIESAKGTRIDGTAEEIDASLLDGNGFAKEKR